MGTRSHGAPTHKGSPTILGHLCCGSATPPSPVRAHSLQGEGEVVLAGLAVAHQVAGLLAQPQQCLRIRPADGPVVPAAGGRGTGCARQRADAPGRTLPRGSSNSSTPGTSLGTAATFEERDAGGTAGVGGQVAGLPLGSLGGCRGHMGTPQLREGQQGEAGRNTGPEKKGRSRSAPGLLVAWPQGSWSRWRGRAAFGEGRTHHWLSRGRAGSILSPTKGPGSAISIFVLLRLLEPCLRAALAFSSLQGEVRPYPSPSDGPARQTHVAADSRDRRAGWAPSFPPTEGAHRKSQSHVTSHHAGSPRAAPSLCFKQGQGSSWTAACCGAPGWARLGPHHTRTGVLAARKPLELFSREASEAQRRFANATRDSAVAA